MTAESTNSLADALSAADEPVNAVVFLTGPSAVAALTEPVPAEDITSLDIRCPSDGALVTAPTLTASKGSFRFTGWGPAEARD